ncbi:hypothetical protein GN956_G5911 [Arapaima gigas]
MASLELSTAGEDGSDFAFDEPLSLSWEIVKGGGTNILAWEESVCEVTVMQLWVFQWFPLHADPQRDGKSGNRTADWTGLFYTYGEGEMGFRRSPGGARLGPFLQELQSARDPKAEQTARREGQANGSSAELGSSLCFGSLQGTRWRLDGLPSVCEVNNLSRYQVRFCQRRRSASVQR